ncbi:MAG: glycosyltransferase involved in cell wall biosynthesis [Halieaceae bacterium]|jgi:glycosyltransferase involved in cell wall biosynthesis
MMGAALSQPHAQPQVQAQATETTTRLLVDVSRTLEAGLHSGIQRVVRGLYRGALAQSAAYNISVHAVRCEGPHWIDVGALPAHPLEQAARPAGHASAQAGQRIRPRAGDTLLLADASWYLDPWPAVDSVLQAGGRLLGFVHDLLPMQQPDWFRADVAARFKQHLEAMSARAEGLLVSSEHVAAQLRKLPGSCAPVSVIPLAGSLQQGPCPAEPQCEVAALAQQAPFYLAVATLEPRKNHALILDAFSTLWREGYATQLVLVGAAGWCNEPLLQRIREHPAFGRRLHWLQGIADPHLVALYRSARALLYLPEDEGFGLPVLEARELGCPVVASDIAPLREAGGDWPQYIQPGDPDALLRLLRQTEAAAPLSPQYTDQQYTDQHDTDRQYRAPADTLRDWRVVAAELLQTAGLSRRAVTMPGVESRLLAAGARESTRDTPAAGNTLNHPGRRYG